MRLPVLSLFAGCLAICTVSNAQQSSAEGQKPGAVQYQSAYGFCISLPESWRGFSVVEDRWKGFNPRGEGPLVTGGPLVRIRNPRWTENDRHEDIPIMVFTLEQWQSLGKTFIVS